MSLTQTSDTQARCTLLTEYDFDLEWRTDSHHIAGAEFELRCDRLRAFVSWRFPRIEADGGDVLYRWKALPKTSDRLSNPTRTLLRARLPYGLRAGQTVRLRLRTVPGTFAGVGLPLSIWTRPGVIGSNWGDQPEAEPKREEASQCTLSLAANVVERLRVYCRPTPGPAGTVRAILVPQDRFGNPAAFAQPVAVQLTWQGRTEAHTLNGPKIVELPAAPNIARATATLCLDDLALEENLENGTLDGTRVTVTSNPVWPSTVDGRQPAFGEFHWHTDFSGDGQRPIEEALKSARDLFNHDFTAPGDHNPQGSQWDQTVAALEAFDNPGAFATFFGWENGSSIGHENYYFTTPDHPLRCAGEAGVRGGGPLKNAEARCRQQDFIGIPHHTNALAETRRLEDDAPFWHAYPWTEPQDYLRLVEIFQTRGNQERNVYTDPWRGWHQNNGASVQDALGAGHRLGFTGGTDNHCGWPGRAFSAHNGAGRHPVYSELLTGVWTERLDRQGVYDALHARHTWAVWDTRAIVHYTLNGVLGGGDLVVKEGEDLTAHLRMSAESPFRLIELVSEGQALWRGAQTDLDVDEDVPLGPARGSTHVYLRALTRDGGVLYASPVFVEVSSA